MPRPLVTVSCASQAVASYGCDATGRAKGVGGGGRHRVLRQFGYKSLTGAAGWVVWAGLGGWRRRGDVCVLALFVFLHDRSHDMPCICAKYLIFTVISCSSLFLSLTMRFFLLPHQDRVPYGLGDQVSPVPVEILGPSRRSKVPVRAIAGSASAQRWPSAAWALAGRTPMPCSFIRLRPLSLMSVASVESHART